MVHIFSSSGDARSETCGHQRANFAIVGAADHAASPHHEPVAERGGSDRALAVSRFLLDAAPA